MAAPRRYSKVLTVVWLVAFFGLVQGQNTGKGPSNSQQRDTEAIHELERRDIRASKLNDVDTLISLWAEDGVLLQPDSAPIIGKDAIRNLLEQQKQQAVGTEITEYEENWRELRIVSNYAFEWGDMTVTVKLPSGKSVDQTVTAIRILRRGEDGSWKVARVAVTPGAKQ